MQSGDVAHNPWHSPFWAAPIAISGPGNWEDPRGSAVPAAAVCVFITQMSNYLTKDFV